MHSFTVDFQATYRFADLIANFAFKGSRRRPDVPILGEVRCVLSSASFPFLQVRHSFSYLFSPILSVFCQFRYFVPVHASFLQDLQPVVSRLAFPPTALLNVLESFVPT